MDPIRSWVEEITPTASYSPQDLYRAALVSGVGDPKAIYLAVALLDASEKLIARYPTVPFDHLCDGVAQGLVGQGEFLRARLWRHATLVAGYHVARLKHRLRRFR